MGRINQHAKFQAILPCQATPNKFHAFCVMPRNLLDGWMPGQSYVAQSHWSPANLPVSWMDVQLENIMPQVPQGGGKKRHLKMVSAIWRSLFLGPDMSKVTYRAFFVVKSNSYIQHYLSIYLVVYSLHHNVLPTLQSVPLMTNGPLYPITQDSSCHGQHTMPRNPWSYPMTSSA